MKLIKKLIQGWWHYELYEDNVLIGSTKDIDGLHRLSFNNCELIEYGYDKISLAKDYTNKQPLGTKETYNAFLEGFEAAIRLLGEKRFTTTDMVFAFVEGTNVGAQFESMCNYDSGDNYEAHEFYEECEKEFSETLRIKSEWDVKIIEIGDFTILEKK